MNFEEYKEILKMIHDDLLILRSSVNLLKEEVGSIRSLVEESWIIARHGRSCVEEAWKDIKNLSSKIEQNSKFETPEKAKEELDKLGVF